MKNTSSVLSLLRKDGFFPAVMLGICLCFYLFFAIYDGAVICVDSPSYIRMDISREPLYPLLLAAFRKAFAAFPEDFYLTAVAFFQSILAAFSSWSLVNYIRKECRLSRVISLCLLAVPLAVSLLCRFAAARGSMYSNSILTEGIAISCYLLFFRYLLEYCFHKSRKSLLLCAVLSFLMISTRKQMLVSLAMLVVCVVLVKLREKKLWRGILLAAGCGVGIMGAAALFDLGYNYALRGDAVRHSSDGRFLTTMAFYTAEREDADYIRDEEIRELFLEIYDACEEQGYLKHSAGEGWLNRVTHFGDYYDCIQIDTMWPMVNEYVREHYGTGEVELSEEADRIMGEINKALIPRNIRNITGSFADNFLSGLITTVARRNRLLNWYSLGIYLLYAVLLARLVWEKKKRDGRKDAETGKENGRAEMEMALADNRILQITRLVLLSILFNVGLVSTVIFCQTRYTIYNMPLFYMGLILLGYSFWKDIVKKRRLG